MTSATILGCRVDTLGVDDAVRAIVALARGSQPSLVVTIGTEMIVHAQRDAAYRAVLATSALALCDTIGVVLAARLHGIRIDERVTGIELLDPLCAALARENVPVALLGGKGDTAARAAAALRARHPALVVASARDGYFAPSDDAAVAAEIARGGAQVLFVAMGFPRQERWIADHLKETRCAVGIGVGGSFDVLAGNVRRAPRIWRKLNLEWCYRLIREPRRWRRQLALPMFVILALRERLSPAIRRHQ